MLFVVLSRADVLSVALQLTAQQPQGVVGVHTKESSPPWQSPHQHISSVMLDPVLQFAFAKEDPYIHTSTCRRAHTLGPCLHM